MVAGLLGADALPDRSTATTVHVFVPLRQLSTLLPQKSPAGVLRSRP